MRLNYFWRGKTHCKRRPIRGTFHGTWVYRFSTYYHGHEDRRITGCFRAYL
jgi:hypothetical protein